MTEAVISKEEIMAVFPTVQKTVAEALGCDVEDIKIDVSVIEGLDAESIDFLDLIFRLERAFKIKVPRGKIIEDVRGDMAVEDFEQNGLLTEKGLVRLRDYLSEIPDERFKPGMRVDAIARLYTPETFCKLVIRAQRAQAAG